MSEDGVILVGVDGSPESLGAVDWAVARAARDGWRVHILCAYSLPSFTTASLDGGYAALDDTAVRSGAQAVVDEAVARAQDKDVTVTGSLETGDPAGVLVDLSGEAALAVVGLLPAREGPQHRPRHRSRRRPNRPAPAGGPRPGHRHYRRR